MFFIRSAGRDDLKRVSALFERCWHATNDTLYGQEKADEIFLTLGCQTELKRQIERPAAEFVVADDGERLGGFAYAHMAPEEADLAVLGQLFVDEDFSGQGIGRDLFAEVETCFPDARRLRAEIAPENDKGRRFLTGLGMAEVGWTRDLYVKNSGLQGLIFEKYLIF